MKKLTTLLLSILFAFTTHACENCYYDSCRGKPCTNTRPLNNRDLQTRKLIVDHLRHAESEITLSCHNICMQSFNGSPIDSAKELLKIINLMSLGSLGSQRDSSASQHPLLTNMPIIQYFDTQQAPVAQQPVNSDDEYSTCVPIFKLRKPAVTAPKPRDDDTVSVDLTDIMAVIYGIQNPATDTELTAAEIAEIDCAIAEVE